VAVERSPCAITFMVGIDDPRDLAPIRTVRLRVEKAQVSD
jgi:hypothetical protein